MPAYGAVKHGKDFYFSVDITTGGALTDISGDTTEVSWPQAGAIAEAMGAGDSYEEYVAGLKGSKLSLSCMINDAAAGAWTCLKSAAGAIRSCYYAPFGNTSGYPLITAEVLFTEVSPSTNLTDVAKFSASGVSTGTITVTTVT